MSAFALSDSTPPTRSAVSVEQPPAPTSPVLTIEQRRAREFAFQPGWLDLISSLYGYRIMHLVAHDDAGQLAGYLPLASVNSALTGRRVVGLPFTDYAPMLASNAEAANELIEQAIHLTKLERARYLELRTGRDPLLAAREDLTASELYVRFLLPLEKDPERLLAKMRPRMRSQIRQAAREGLSVRWGYQRRDMRLFYQLHLQTRTLKHGMPAQPFDYFLGLWDTFAASGQVRLLLTEYHGKCIAAAILLLAGGIVRPNYVATDQRYLELNATRVMEWEAIKWACESGFDVWDFGRTARDNEGLRQYKRAWGSIEEDLVYYYHPHVSGLAATSERSRKYELITTTWRHLPLGTAATLGGRLYRHLG